MCVTSAVFVDSLNDRKLWVLNSFVIYILN